MAENSHFLHRWFSARDAAWVRRQDRRAKLSRFGLCVAGLWVLLCLGGAVQAQYHLDVWTADNGLPQNIVRGIAQTSDGYLWIATLNGLARFDGIRFTIFDKSNTPGITSNRFESMHKDREDGLWLFTEGGRITRYHKGAFEAFGAAQGLPENVVRGIAGDEAGHIWIVLSDKIEEWNEATGRFVDITPANSTVKYSSFYWRSSGFWGVDDNNFRYFVTGQFLTFPLPVWLPASSIWSAAYDRNGAIWIETFDGKHIRLAEGKMERVPEGPGHSFDVDYIDSRKHPWTVHVERHLARSLEYETAGGKSSILFSQIYEDQEMNLWVGTEGKGLFRLHRQLVKMYSDQPRALPRNIYPIYQDSSGTIWTGDWSVGMTRFQNGRSQDFGEADGLPNRLVTAILMDDTGRLWAGTHGGLTTFKDGKFFKAAQPAIPDRAIVQAIHQGKDGTLWFGSSAGLVAYKDGVSRTLTVADGLATNDVRVILEGRQGDLWIAGYGGLTNLHNGQTRRWRERDGLPSDNIRSLYQDSDGVLWIGTYDNGLVRLKDEKLTRYSVRNGLFNSGVFQILEDSHANFWISCNRGIYRVSKKELNDFATGARQTITSVAYGKSDGMVNVECNGGLSPAGTRTADGKMLFPTQDGVAVIDPDEVAINPRPPPVAIESVLLDRTAVPAGGRLRVAPGKIDLEIRYTAISFIDSAQTQFKYRLEGLDSAWIDAGVRRTAYYARIPPGNYVFHVIAGNSDGVWNEVGKSLPVTVLAPFYRTWWFSGLVAMALALLTWQAWMYRVNQLKQAQVAQQAFSQQMIASQERERKRIAAELHDSLGQRLVIINNLALNSLHARSKTASPQEAALALEEISAEALLAIKETRDISYDLRPFQLDRLGLSKAIGSVIRTVSAASGIAITSEIDNIDNLFPEELRINFYRIVQESLTNIMKHAKASTVHVRIHREARQMTLTIHDNGKGFVPENHEAQAGKRGFGMSGMAERAHLLGGRLKVRSTPGHGTDVIVEFSQGGYSRG